MLILLDVLMYSFANKRKIFKTACTHVSAQQLGEHETHKKKYKKSGINRTVNSAVPPARFTKYCSGVKDDEREDGNDVNVEPEGRAGEREGERVCAAAAASLSATRQCSEESSSNSLLNQNSQLDLTSSFWSKNLIDSFSVTC